MTLPPQIDPYDYHQARIAGSRAERLFHAGRLRLVRSALGAAPGRILDVGAGSGGLAIPLAEDGHAVVALEASAEHCERLRERAAAAGLSIEVVQGDASAAPFEDASFDTVLVASVVHLAPDPGPILREAERVCRPRGRLVVAGPWRWHPKSSRALKTLLRGGRAPETTTRPFSASLCGRYLDATLQSREVDRLLGYEVTVWSRPGR